MNQRDVVRWLDRVGVDLSDYSDEFVQGFAACADYVVETVLRPYLVAIVRAPGNRDYEEIEQAERGIVRLVMGQTPPLVRPPGSVVDPKQAGP